MAAIREHCPDDGFLGEESGRSGDRGAARTWIIDPLDGTSNYLQHFPVWSVSIGLRENGETIAGVIYEPLRDLFFTAERGAGSAALDLAYTAAGVFDGFFEMHLAAWDVAAGALLVTEAGGTVTDFSGGQRWLDRGNIVGATPKVHEDLLRVIGRHVTEDELDHRKGARLGL
jgi:myo-inositol-1(or 4)-monophosphatase